MKKIAVGMAHGHAAKWLQTSIYSIKNVPAGLPFDIFVAATWDNNNPEIAKAGSTLKAITTNDLGQNVHIHECIRRKNSHATGLDEILDLLDPNEYEYFFTTETDCRAMQPGWLQWFHNFMKDNNKIGVAGFYWEEGDHHHNINPSATLYRVDMLKQYQAEVRANKENMFYHYKENKSGDLPGMDPSIPNVVGVFSETRGLPNPTPAQAGAIIRGVPFASWFEPGQWLYCRLQGEWDEVRVPCEHLYMQTAGHTTPEGSYYGSKANPMFLHYWGGTRCYDFLKHPVSDNFVKSCTPHWMEREDRIWKEVVPEQYRQIVYDIEAEIDVMGWRMKNLGI
jgi:hypothetical protein